jgi:hypothetical protein
MDKEPISKFVDLFNTHQLPSLLNEGIMDPQILKHYLVLHDQQDGPQDMYYSSLFLLKKHLFKQVIRGVKTILEKLGGICSSYPTNLLGIGQTLLLVSLLVKLLYKPESRSYLVVHHF